MKYCPLCGKNYEDEAQLCEIDGATLRISGKVDPYLGNLIKGRYKIVSKLGEGGMGTVYLAEQVSVGRKVAIKFLLGNYASDDAFIGRFRREARLAASLNHRNIVIVFDFDQSHDGALFIVMEYLGGEKLSDLVRRDGPLEISRATRLGLQIAEGLDAAHQAGVIHRDIKPDNVMVSRSGASEEIKLMDFGIARLRDAGNASQITRAGLIVGTPAYMAPEQVEGGEVSDKTDMYALGVVLYEMLSGKVPFTAATPGAVLIKHIKEMPLPLRKLRRELPSSLERVVMQALEKDPQKRQRTMSEVVQQLRTAEEQIRGNPPGRATEPIRKWDLIGQAFRKTEQEKPSKAAPPPDQAPRESNSERTILDEPGPQWVPTQAFSGDELNLRKRRAFAGHKLTIMLLLLGILGALGTVVYVSGGWNLPTSPLTATKPPASDPSAEIVSVTVSPEKTTLAPKERIVLTATGKFADGREQQVSSDLKWHSSNHSVVAVNADGGLEAQREGLAEVTAQVAGKVSAPVTLVVKQERAQASMPQAPALPEPVPTPTLKSIIIVSPKRELQANERTVLTATGQYSDGKETAVKDGVTWKSSDERIASVDAQGRLTAHRSGQVRLDATYEGITSPAISLVVRETRSDSADSSSPSAPKPELDKRRPDVRENLANAQHFYEQGKYAEALTEIEPALKLDPVNKEARSLRAKIVRAWEAEKKLIIKDS
jgi:serine/threonine protein kinase